MRLLTAESIDTDRLFKLATPQSIQHGRNDYAQDRVKLGTVGFIDAHATVQMPNTSYTVMIRMQNDQIMLICSCNQGHMWTLCRHRIATMLALRDYLLEHPPSMWKAVLKKATPVSTRSASNAQIVFCLQDYGNQWLLHAYAIADKHLPDDLPADPFERAEYIADHGLFEHARPINNRIVRASYPRVHQDAIVAVNLLTSSSGYGYYSGYGGDNTLDTVLPLMRNCVLFAGTDDEPFETPVKVEPEPVPMELSVVRHGSGLRLHTALRVPDEDTPFEESQVDVIARKPLWVLVDDHLLQVSDSSGVGTALLDNPQLDVPQAEVEEFLTEYLLPLSEQLPVNGDAISWQDVDVDPVPRLYLSEEQNELVARLAFGYGAYELPYAKRTPPTSTIAKPGTLEVARIARRPEAEQTAVQALSGHSLKRTDRPEVFALRKNAHPVDFLLHQVPKLTAQGFEIYGEEALTSARVNRNRPMLSFSVSTGIDWFDVKTVVNYGELTVALKDIRKALRKRERFIKLADGTIGALPQDWIERYRHLFALGEETGDGMRVSTRHLTLLDQILADSERARTDPEFERRRQRLRDFSSIQPRDLPRGFAGELRPYQHAGYNWLHFLHDYDFGGCLADDMGTGKTIQTLAFLQSLREAEPNGPASLIVMPRSLLFNWEREAQRFTPDLQVYIHADQDRVRSTEEFDVYDLVLTTYGVMLRDIELLRAYRFHYAILDESQAIKNPLSETARAARQLISDHRLALTGTPVENSTAELWSQFAFLNPGLLGSLEYFREEFVNPIERKQDEGTARFLSRMVYPFILRRTKEQVATDLPELSERLLETDMEPAQRALYDKQRDYYRSLLLGLIETEGLNDTRLKILEGLLRLRQICNHPRLVDASFKGSSAKFELLIETLDTLRAEGHKALVFSQFVQMLGLVREALDDRKIPYAYLDGQTQNRQAAVDAFQQDPKLPFFLISLKAGGVGLNLTAADYVIHIDPWWNPAVEMQATDRAHRIGQDKPVFVYKLVTRDSVEQKILALQERKRALVEQIIAPESSFLKSLTRDDVEVLFS